MFTAKYEVDFEVDFRRASTIALETLLLKNGLLTTKWGSQAVKRFSVLTGDKA